MQLTCANQQWLDDFSALHGRALRILHIGNIANNAYNNAKLLNEAGIENDVVCYDYYHTMGCPEWEDADFTGVVIDDFQPVWHSLDIKNFARPEWFVQGPQKVCLEYLLARRTGRIEEAASLWSALSLANRTRRAIGLRPRLRKWKADAIASVIRKLGWIYRLSQSDVVTAFPAVRRFSQGPFGLFTIILAPLLRLTWVVFVLSVTASVKLAKAAGFFADVPASESALGLFDKTTEALVEEWPKAFPDRSDVLTLNDFLGYGSSIERWRQLFSHYDIVIGYSTDGMWPLLAGKKFFAFEHGTIREIPYHATTQGRNAAMTYRKAEHAFVTNFDCLSSAQKLAPGRFTLLNHPYDEDHANNVAGWEALRGSLRSILDSDLVCFFPTRHDWVPGTGYADKSNDVFLRALAELRRNGARVGVVCCEWGANVAQSKALIADLGMQSYVKWERPMAMVKFERMARACDLVVDQFKLGAFGGIVFKAMAAGAPILTYLDAPRLLKQYAEIPPVINCDSQQSIFEKLGAIARTPDQLRDLGKASREWIKKYHAKADTVNLQLDQFRKTVMSDAHRRSIPIRTKEISHE